MTWWQQAERMALVCIRVALLLWEENCCVQLIPFHLPPFVLRGHTNKTLFGYFIGNFLVQQLLVTNVSEYSIFKILVQHLPIVHWPYIYCYNLLYKTSCNLI